VSEGLLEPGKPTLLHLLQADPHCSPCRSFKYSKKPGLGIGSRGLATGAARAAGATSPLLAMPGLTLPKIVRKLKRYEINPQRVFSLFMVDHDCLRLGEQDAACSTGAADPRSRATSLQDSRTSSMQFLETTELENLMAKNINRVVALATGTGHRLWLLRCRRSWSASSVGSRGKHWRQALGRKPWRSSSMSLDGKQRRPQTRSQPTPTLVTSSPSAPKTVAPEIPSLGKCSRRVSIS
jgi:hypothetical protein